MCQACKLVVRDRFVFFAVLCSRLLAQEISKKTGQKLLKCTLRYMFLVLYHMIEGKVLLWVSSVCSDTNIETSVWDKFWPRAWPFILIKHRKLVKPPLQDINPAKVRARPPSNNRKISRGREVKFLLTCLEERVKRTLASLA